MRRFVLTTIAFACALRCAAGLVVDGVRVCECAGGVTTGAVVAAEGLWPVFEIPLGEYWTDFEIKASTNNFAAENNEGGSNLVYYYRSWTADQHGVNPDPAGRVYFTDDCSDDSRVWRLKSADISVSAQLSSTGSVVDAVIFMPSRECACAWMREGNTNLVWSVQRWDDLGGELNFSGDKTRWRPVVPASWGVGRFVP